MQSELWGPAIPGSELSTATRNAAREARGSEARLGSSTDQLASVFARLKPVQIANAGDKSDVAIGGVRQLVAAANLGNSGEGEMN